MAPSYKEMCWLLEIKLQQICILYLVQANRRKVNRSAMILFQRLTAFDQNAVRGKSARFNLRCCAIVVCWKSWKISFIRSLAIIQLPVFIFLFNKTWCILMIRPQQQFVVVFVTGRTVNEVHYPQLCTSGWVCFNVDNILFWIKKRSDKRCCMYSLIIVEFLLWLLIVTAIVIVGLGKSPYFFQDDFFYGQFWWRTRICESFLLMMTYDTPKVPKFKMAAKIRWFCQKNDKFSHNSGMQHVFLFNIWLKEHKLHTFNTNICTWVELHGKITLFWFKMTQICQKTAYFQTLMAHRINNSWY